MHHRVYYVPFKLRKDEMKDDIANPH